MTRSEVSSFYYTYVLKSIPTAKLYLDYTNNLRKRVKEHNKGLSFATSHIDPGG